MASVKIDPKAYPISDVLSLLLLDRTSKENIIFATESYEDRGELFGAKQPITPGLLTYSGGYIIQPRVLKDREEQLSRTRKRAEVFTPSWVCCLMNDHLDEDWFGRKDVFGILEGQSWKPNSERIMFPKGKKWEAYVDSRRLEITCGEAPYLVSRYDMGTGELIPIEERVGILDRKLRIVNENTETEEEWLKWTLHAFQSVYGYEYQGDNLFVARCNMLLTFTEYLEERWQRQATKKELEEITRIISWNIWQMDGLKGTIPMGALYETYHQISFFDLLDMTEPEDVKYHPPCRIYDWRGQKKSIEYNAFRIGGQGSMRFDYIIGNPPYQEAYEGESKGANSIYDRFMSCTYEIAQRVELITPARFLFNAGSTQKAWNERMLSDPHLKVLCYERDASVFFANVEIKGGVAITYHDTTKEFGAIGTFTPYEELNTCLHKVISKEGFKSLSDIIITSFAYHFTEKMHEDHPEAAGMMSKGHAYDLKSSVFERLPQLFFDRIPDDGFDYIQILGRENNERAYKFIRRDYVNDVVNLDCYKVFLPKANGVGAFGETIAPPIIGEPGVGSTETFLSIGAFETKAEAENTKLYIKTKFARTMLGVLKATQDITPGKWKYVPVQDFSPTSDIDWSLPVAAIDQQLYRKYGLSEEEITFIETHVKEMA